MKVHDILRVKGDRVVTVRSDESVRSLVELLVSQRIGAAVVVDDNRVVGIVSERDIVVALAGQGPNIGEVSVRTLMTADPETCLLEDDTVSLAGRMTELRIRHLPVLKGDRLVGIVSIGDVVKSRIDQLTDERDQLVSYVQQ
ncbi:CBS domain-containing protein [Granulicoccus phenolivorans]|uniref:CBS domain-containing protein n=1 Tax=Granulicoccus phenolivorans TaxID=266854 RepID=UPI00047AFF3E|nr:CBS domain-containing protein [Granulicoccus phenolivorans]